MDTIKFDDLMVTLGPPLSLQKGEVVGFTEDVNGIDQLLVQLSSDGDPTPVYVFFNCQHWIYNRKLPVNPSHEQGITAFCMGKIAVVFTYGVNLVAIGIYDTDGRNTLLHPPCWPLFPAGTSFVVLPELAASPGSTWTSPFYNTTTNLPFDMITPGNDVFGEARPLGTVANISGGNKKHGRIVTMHGEEYVAHNIDELLPVASANLFVLPSDMQEFNFHGRSVGYNKSANSFLYGGIPFIHNSQVFSSMPNEEYDLYALSFGMSDDEQLLAQLFQGGSVWWFIDNPRPRSFRFGQLTVFKAPIPCIQSIIDEGSVDAYDLEDATMTPLLLFQSDWPYGDIDGNERGGYYFMKAQGISPLFDEGKYVVYAFICPSEDPSNQNCASGLKITFWHNPVTGGFSHSRTLLPSLFQSTESHSWVQGLETVGSYQYRTGSFSQSLNGPDMPISLSGKLLFTGGAYGSCSGTFDKSSASHTSSSAIVYKHEDEEIARITGNAQSTQTGAVRSGYLSYPDFWQANDNATITHAYHTCVVFHYIRVDLGLYVFSEFEFANDATINYDYDTVYEDYDDDTWQSTPSPVTNFTARFVVWHNGHRTVVSTHQIPWANLVAYLHFAGGWEQASINVASISRVVHPGAGAGIPFTPPHSIYQNTPTLHGAINYITPALPDSLRRCDHALNAPSIRLFGPDSNYWIDGSANRQPIQSFWNLTRIESQWPSWWSLINDPTYNYYFSGGEPADGGAIHPFNPLVVPFIAALGGTPDYKPTALQRVGQFMYLRVYDPFDNSAAYEFFTGPSSYLDKLKAAINPANPSQVTFTDDIS